MNRNIALTIKASSWLDLEKYPTEQKKYNIEDSVENCPQIGYRTLFCGFYDMDLIKFLLSNNEPALILYNFIAYFDSGSKEVLVNEANYLQFDVNKLYLDRKGIYDVIEEMI